MLINSKYECTPVGIYGCTTECSNTDMDIFETRRIKLRQLIDSDFSGNQAAFSRHVDIKPSQINRWLSTTAEKRPVINEVSARQIERKCGKPFDWLDMNDQAIRESNMLESFRKLSDTSKELMTFQIHSLARKEDEERISRMINPYLKEAQ